MSRQGARRRIKIWGRLDPAISRLAGWADEETMRRLLTDPELRGQRTVLFNSLVLSTDAAHQLFDYLAAISAAQVRIYTTVRFRTLSAQVEAIKSISLARLVPGLPYWNEGHPFFREVGLLLP